MRIVFATLLLFALVLPASACFGPKLYIGTPAGVDGELLFHVVAIYIHEKTGVDSLRSVLNEQQTPLSVLRDGQVDLTFAEAPSGDWTTLFQPDNALWLLSGSRPTDDLQFSTVPRALQKLQRLFSPADLALLRQLVAAGTLPATAVRSLYMERGWI